MKFDLPFFRAILERIETIREDEGYSKVNQFTETIGFSNPTYSVLTSNRSRRPSLQLVLCVLNRFPKYCFNWIAFGSGPKIGPEKNSDLDAIGTSLYKETSDKNQADMMDIIEKLNQKLINIMQENVRLREENLELKIKIHEQNIDR